MNIGIIEFSKTHYIAVLTFCRIFRNDNSITCFITEDIHKNINISEFGDINFIVKNDKDSFFDFSKEVIKNVNNLRYDFILFNSLDKLYFENLLMFIKIKTKKLLTIHNVNVFFSKKISFKPTFAIKKLISNYILKRANGINLYSKDIIKYVKDNYRYEKPIFLIPFTNYDSKWKQLYKKQMKTDIIKLVVTGMVDLRRRNYSMVLNLLEMIKEKDLGNKIEIVILGTAYDEQGRNMLKMFEKYPNVKVYHSFVSDGEFTKQISSAHFIVGNLNRYITINGIVEEYSITKQSGINASMIQYGLPCICLGDMQCSKELEGMYISFKTLEKYVEYFEELLYDDKKYHELRDRAFTISEQFSIEKLRSKFEEDYYTI